MNTRVVISGLVAAAALLAQSPGGPRGRGIMGPGFGGPGPGGRGFQTVTGAPYSGVEVRTSQQLLANGNLIQRQTQTNVYRDSQGRVRTEMTIQRPDGTTATRVSIADPVAGVVHELDAERKISFDRPAHFGNNSGSSSSSSSSAQTSATRALPANETRETLAAQTMNGLIASGTRITRTIPAGQIGNSQPIQTVREVWTSSDLKVAVMTKISDPRTGTVVAQLTNVNRSEPDASLFQVPADYTVRKGPGGFPGARRGAPAAPQQQ
jgi:hypothetical protein